MNLRDFLFLRSIYDSIKKKYPIVKTAEKNRWCVGFGLFKIKRTVKKDGKQLYKDTLRNEFFGTVTDIVSGSHPDNEVHIYFLSNLRQKL